MSKRRLWRHYHPGSFLSNGRESFNKSNHTDAATLRRCLKRYKDMKVVLIFVLSLITGFVFAHEVPKELVAGSDEKIKYEKKISEGKCSTKEKVNRHLLQQNWFFDESKTDHGIIFGQTGFSDYSRSQWTTASYCIDGNSIIATYYDYEPRFSINGELVHEQRFLKLRSSPSITMVVETLTDNKLILYFPASKDKLDLYR